MGVGASSIQENRLGVSMAGDHSRQERSWREIAEEVATERDLGKVAELSRELIEALDKDARDHTGKTPEIDKERAHRRSA